MKHKIVLSFEVDAKGETEVMAIGKAISEHIAALKEVGSLVGVEYVWGKTKASNNASDSKIQSPQQQPKNYTDSRKKQSNNYTGSEKSNNAGFVYDAELKASKKYKNGK